MTSLQSAFTEFMLACEADGLQPSTTRVYRSLVGRYINQSEADSIRDVTPHDMRAYMLSLRKAEYSEHTISDTSRALHRFWRWVAGEYNTPNPMRTLKYLQPPPTTIPKAASLDDVIAMFRAAEGGMVVERDQAILAFALDTGCRAAGICGLKVADLDILRRSAFVTEKGNKTRAVVFTGVTAALLWRWIEKRQPAEVLFYSTDTWEALKPNSLYLLFKRLAKRAGVKERFSPHTFRHLFGKEYVMAGGDVGTLARILGHEDINTTIKHYSIFSSAEVAAAHEKYSPIKQVAKKLDKGK